MDRFVTRINRNSILTNDTNRNLQTKTPRNPSSVTDPDDFGMEKPSRPKSQSYSKDQNNKSLCAKWYEQFWWLEYSKSKDVAFCYPCRRFHPCKRKNLFLPQKATKIGKML